MEQMKTNNGKRGGLLKGKPHYDKDGNSLGGIKAVVTDAGGKPVELEGGEVIINKAASKKYWKELSKINQSAGNGVPIGPPMGADEDPEEFKDGGRVIEFNPNHIPNKWVVKYAISIKENHPEIWKLGGNIFGNEAFINLRRVIDRGHWLDSEEWMYIKWRSYVARHKQDFRIAGVVAMLKWCDKVDKGWAYMKDLIEEKIENIKSKETSTKSKMENGGEVKKPIDEISGVLLNHLKKYSKEVYGEDIDDSSFMLMAVKEDNKYQAQKVSATTKSGKEIVVKVQELYMENGGEVEGDDFLEVKNYILQRHPKKNDVFKGGKVDGYKIVKTAKIIKSYGTLFELWLLDTKKNKLGSFNRRIVSYYPNKKRISDFNKVPSSTTKGEFYEKWNDETLEGKMSKGGEVKNLPKQVIGYTKLGDKIQNTDELSSYQRLDLEYNVQLTEREKMTSRTKWIELSKEIDDHALAGKGKISKMSSSERKVYNQKLEKLKTDRKLYHDNYKEDLFDYLKLNPRTQTTFEKKLVKAKKSLEDARKNNSWSVMSAIEEEIKRGERIVFEEVKLGKEFNPKVGANAMNPYSPFPTTEFEQFKGSSKMSKGGELSKGIKAEKEHQSTIDKIYSHEVKKSKAAELIAKDHLNEDKKYYSKLEKMESKKFAGGGTVNEYEIGTEGIWGGRGNPRIKVTKISAKTISYIDFSDNKAKFDTKEKFDRLFKPDNFSVSSTQTTTATQSIKQNEPVVSSTTQPQTQQQTPSVKKQVKTIETEPIKRKFDSEKDYLTIFANYFEKDNATSTKVTDKMKRTNIIKDFVLSTEGIGGFDKEKLKLVYSYINEQ